MYMYLPFLDSVQHSEGLFQVLLQNLDNAREILKSLVHTSRKATNVDLLCNKGKKLNLRPDYNPARGLLDY